MLLVFPYYYMSFHASHASAALSTHNGAIGPCLFSQVYLYWRAIVFRAVSRTARTQFPVHNRSAAGNKQYLDAFRDTSSGKEFVVSVECRGADHVPLAHEVTILQCSLHLQSCQVQLSPPSVLLQSSFNLTPDLAYACATPQAALNSMRLAKMLLESLTFL